MKETLTLILAGGQGERLAPLTRDRAKPAVPFGGLYRIIDFTLSNCINSGLKRIYVLTQYKSQSLDDHLRLGWNIFSSAFDEFLFAVPPQLRTGASWYLGTADAVAQNIGLLRMRQPRRVWSSARRMGVVTVAADNRIVSFQEKPARPRAIPGQPDLAWVNMGVYVFETDALIRWVTGGGRRGVVRDFGRDILPRAVRRRSVFAHPFRDGVSNYWRDIGTLDSYYEASMDLLRVAPPFNLYDTTFPVHSLVRPRPPSKTVFAGGEPGRIGVAHDSLVCNGCIISGGRVERSILSPDVRIHSYSTVEDSILFDRVDVGRHARIRRAIIDKGVRIPAGATIGFAAEADARRFPVTASGVVVVAKGEQLE
ncbi:MAG: glucose-1-phosphate adenylyltransferase [Verrucomicrobia bacterium]|nr:glucose-1-phosphate adenylyltransferase [Verrucomicrobiota bacterium]